MNIDDFLKTADKPPSYTIKYGPVCLPLTHKAMIREAMLACAAKQLIIVLERSRAIVSPVGSCKKVWCAGGIVWLEVMHKGERLFYHAEMDFDKAAAILTDFFEKSVLPSCICWQKYCSGAAGDKSFMLVTSDDTYRFVSFRDVEAVLSRIDKGTCTMLSLRTETGQEGYFEVSRGDGCYLLEVTTGIGDEGRGFRTECRDRDRLLAWLRKFYDEMTYPVFDTAWTEFDIQEYYKKLIDKYLENGK